MGVMLDTVCYIDVDYDTNFIICRQIFNMLALIGVEYYTNITIHLLKIFVELIEQTEFIRMTLRQHRLF